MMSDSVLNTSPVDRKISALSIDCTDIFKDERMFPRSDIKITVNNSTLSTLDSNFNQHNDLQSSSTTKSQKSSHSSVRKRLEARAMQKAKDVLFEKENVDKGKRPKSITSSHNSVQTRLEGRAREKAKEALLEDENREKGTRSKSRTLSSLRHNVKDGLKNKASPRPALNLNDMGNVVTENSAFLQSKDIGRTVEFGLEIHHGHDDTIQPNREDVTLFHSKSMWNQANDHFSEKQCQIFTNWLNHILKPMSDVQVEFHSATDNPSHVVNPKKNTILSQKLEKARLSANDLYHSREFLHIRTALAAEIARGDLSIRTDRDVFADISLRNQMIDVLLSYSPTWLRLGLETIFQEKLSIKDLLQNFNDQCQSRQSLGLLPLDSQKPSIRKLFRKFISDRVLNDSTIHYKYTTGKCITPSGKFEVEYKKELYQTVLRRIISLVIFLNHAKLNNAVETYPVLFNKDSKLKSTKDVLRILSLDYLRGEGNLLKHLAGLGITSLYEQHYIDEMDFSIKNLAVDLRDGVRLVKLASIVSGDEEFKIVCKLRVPANSRLQKLHNVETALCVFRELGIPKMRNIQAHHIVDGHRIKVLEMLWLIMIHFQIPSLVSPRNFGGNMDAKFPDGGDELCHLLLQLSQSICSPHGRSVDNFSTCFQDGKVLCLIINFCLPSLISIDEILPTRMDLSLSNTDSSPLDAQAARNEHHNRSLVLKCARDIGGLPVIFPDCDSSTFEDERSIIVFLAYLFSNVYQSAAIDLHDKNICSSQAQKSPRYNIMPPVLKSSRGEDNESMSDQIVSWMSSSVSNSTLDRAAAIIQSKVRGFIARRFYKNSLYTDLATIIQSVYRGWKARKFYAKVKLGVVMIQRAWIRSLSRKQFHWFKIQTVTKIQAWYRSWRDVSKFSRHRVQIIALQTCVRRYQAVQQYSADKVKVRLRNLEMKTASKKIQRLYRDWKATTSATVIQKMWRGFLARAQYSCDLSDIVFVQSLVRKKRACKVFNEIKRRHIFDSCQHMQRIWRGYSARNRLLILNHHASRIQSWYRSQMQLCKNQRLNQAAVSIQTCWRGFVNRIDFYILRVSAVRIQTAFRRLRRRSKVIQRLSAEEMMITIIQRAYRRYRNRCQLISCSVTIQSMIRCFLARKYIASIRKSITCIQSLVRGSFVRQKASRSVKMAAQRISLAIKSSVSTPNMTLGYRAKHSLVVLTNSEAYKLTDLANALRTLEMVTRLSKQFCMAFLQSKGHDALCAFMVSCNRSLPHVNLINIGLLIFSNISHKIDTTDIFARADFIDFLLDINHMFRDKDSIFCNASLLIRYFVHSDTAYKIILCNRPESKKRLHGVFKLNTKRVTEKGKSPLLRQGLEALGDVLSMIDMRTEFNK